MLTDSIADQIGFAKRESTAHARMWRWRIGSRPSSTADRPCRPTFIVGCPRSGTTLLFALLARHPGFRSLPGEGHVIWNAYQHPRRKGWSSDRATAVDIHPDEEAYVFGVIHKIATEHRFLDKTPKNVLKLPYLASLFPDAQFVFLRRDGRATVSSLIEGWIARRGISYRLPERLHLAEYQGRLWSYVLPPGWRDLLHSSIPEIAAAQYVASNDIALGDIPQLSAGSVIETSYEDLLARPVEECVRILSLLDLSNSAQVLEMANELNRHITGAISAPRADKWRERKEEIDRVLPLIAPTMARLGYKTEVSP